MQQSNYEVTLNELWHRLIRLSLNKPSELKYKRLGDLSTVEIGIINMVSLKPELIFKELCEEYSLPKSTLTNIIDRMEKRGYLERIISQRDRRSYGLKLTEEGELVQKEHVEYEKEVLNSLIGAFDKEEEKQQFVELVGKLVEKLEIERLTS